MVSDIITASGHTINAVQVRQAVINWGRENFRKFPWRATTDPYHILMSEVMLHRTQAKQVVPIYEQFIHTFPNVKRLAKAEKENIRRILFSLGLHWRIDLVYEIAHELMNRFGGEVPKSKEDLLSLSGVSDYIAGAVRCFAWNLPEPIPDTNTIRIAGRLFGLQITESSRRNPKFKTIITRLVDPDNPREFNYAQLDLANKICTRRQAPSCNLCPLLEWCCFGTSAIASVDQG